MPRGETPAWASARASTEPASIPAYTRTFASAMIAPRRSTGDRHCSRALSGTNRNPLKIPKSAMMIRVPVIPGPTIANAKVQAVRPKAPRGSRPYSTFAPESRPAHTHPAPMPTVSATRGNPVCHSGRRKTFDA